MIYLGQTPIPGLERWLLRISHYKWEKLGVFVVCLGLHASGRRHALGFSVASDNSRSQMLVFCHPLRVLEDPPKYIN